MDRLSKEQRSRNMAAVRSKNNKSTESALLVLLKENKLTGWRRNYKKAKGVPDFAFPKRKIAIFLDGCFWHKCPSCFIPPKTKKAFWRKKIDANVMRDKKVNIQLRRAGWKILRFWEHQIKKNPQKAIEKIKKYLARS